MAQIYANNKKGGINKKRQIKTTKKQQQKNEERKKLLIYRMSYFKVIVALNTQISDRENSAVHRKT